MQKVLKEHWDQLQDAFKAQCTAMGMQVVEPPTVPDLPKEHLQSLPSDPQEAVEKLVGPDQPDPPLASKVSRLSER